MGHGVLIKENVFLLNQVHRLVVVDDENRVMGVISLSDILSYLVLRPLGKFVIMFII